MGNGRFLLGNLVVIGLASLSIIGLLPWIAAALLIIAVAVFASLPSRVPISSSNSPSVTTMKQPSAEADSEQSGVQGKKNRTVQPLQEDPEKSNETRHTQQLDSSKSSLDGLKTDASEKPRVIPSDDYLSFEVALQEGEEFVAEVSGDGDLNVYVLTEENLTSLDLGQEFWYEVGNEGVRTTTLKFSPEESGTWILVVENCENRTVSATVKLVFNKPSHPVPFLKSEKLELPDEKLDNKLRL